MPQTSDVNRLTVLIEANTKSYERAMMKMQKTTEDRLRRIEGQTRKTKSEFDRMGQSMNALGPMAARVGGLLAAGLSVGAAIKYAEAYNKIQNSLKITGLEGTKLANVQDQLFQSAIRNAAPVEALVDLYSKASLVQSQLGVSTQELLKFTDNVAVALRVSGKSAQESSGALMQLGQALGSGTVRAEEFNSILEGAPTIAIAAAAGLKEAGGSVAKLRAMMLDGEISSIAFFRAFEAGAPVLQEMAERTTPTLSQAWQNLSTIVLQSVGQFDDATQATDLLAKTVQGLADTIKGIDWDAIMSVPGQSIQNAMAKMSAFGQQVRNFLDDTFGDGTTAADYDFLKPQQVSAPNTGTPEGFTYGVGAKRSNAKVTPVSLADFSPTSTSNANSASASKASALQAEEDRVNKLRGAYSSASEIIDQFAEKQKEAAAKQKEMADAISDFAQGIVSDLRNGVSAADALNNALMRIADSLMSAGIDGLAGLLAGAFSPKPVISSGLSWGGPRALGGPVDTGSAYRVGENGPELFVPNTAGKIVSTAAGSMGSSAGSVFNIDARGAQAGVADQIKQALEQYDRGSYSRHVRNTFQGRKRGDVR